VIPSAHLRNKTDPRADFRRFRVHDLNHTFGRRLRAAGVSFEDRQVLLGQKSLRLTTHYSAAEVQNLIEASKRVTAGSSPQRSRTAGSSPYGIVNSALSTFRTH
jgi:hypothetical protein